MKTLSEKLAEVYAILLISGVVFVVGAILTGCQTTEPRVITQVQIQKIEVPRSLLTCSSEPVFGSVTVSVRDLMKFADHLAKAGADCRSKLDAVKRIVEVQ